MNKSKIIKIKCPHCDKIFNYYDSDFRPFCSDRCRLIDLGSWLDESYRVPVTDHEFEEDSERNIDEE